MYPEALSATYCWVDETGCWGPVEVQENTDNVYQQAGQACFAFVVN